MQYACITGADRGLGYDLTLAFLRRGFTVFAGRYMPEWPFLREVPPGLAGRLFVVDLDVSDGDSVREAVRTIASQTDRLDVLVNNAGISSDHDSSVFGSIDYGKVADMYSVNAVGPLRMTHAAADLLMAGETRLVVNISSEAGQINQTWREGWYGYCMSKAALNIQSNILHNELRKRRGKVLVIHPGWMKTYMSGQLSEQGDLTSEEAARSIADTIHRQMEEKDDRPHPAFVDYKGEPMSWT